MTHAHIRRFVASMHAGGRSPRGIALILSGWRGLYVWLGREGLVASNPVQDVRSPKAAKPLPNPSSSRPSINRSDTAPSSASRRGCSRVIVMTTVPSRICRVRSAAATKSGSGEGKRP